MTTYRVIEDNGVRAYVYKGFFYRDEDFDDLMMIIENERREHGRAE